jgi:hypothetical protein
MNFSPADVAGNYSRRSQPALRPWTSSRGTSSADSVRAVPTWSRSRHLRSPVRPVLQENKQPPHFSVRTRIEGGRHGETCFNCSSTSSHCRPEHPAFRGESGTKLPNRPGARRAIRRGRERLPGRIRVRPSDPESNGLPDFVPVVVCQPSDNPHITL